jgi:hypothetical protein
MCAIFFLNVHAYVLAGISQSVMDWMSQGIVQFPAGAKYFFYTVLRSVLGSNHLYLQCVLGAHSPEVKWLKCDADHPPPSTAEVKTVWSCASTAPVA